MLAEYDFSKAVRGKYFERYRQGTNVVMLDPDVADVFPDATAVNDALRLLVAVADAKALRRQERTRRPKKAQQPKSGGQRKAEKTPQQRRLAADSSPAPWGAREGIERWEYAEADAEIARAAKMLDREAALVDAATAELARIAAPVTCWDSDTFSGAGWT